MLAWTTTYCVDRSQREGEVEVVAVVDVSVLHEPQIFISHHLRGTGQDISEDFFPPFCHKEHCCCESALYLIDACGHLLDEKALLLSLTHQAGEEGETVVVGPGGTGRGLWGYIRRRWSRPAGYTQY